MILTTQYDKIQKDKNAIYPLADYPYRRECESLGINPSFQTKKDIGAIRTGEFRPPRSGEWFLSGAYIEAYRAENDLNTSYHIAKLVRIREVTKIEIVE